MNTKSLVALAAAVLCATAAAEEVTVSIGMRAWQNTWRGNGVAGDARGTPTFPVQLTVLDSDKEVTGIPFALVRYGNFGVSASAYLPTDYRHFVRVSYDDIRRKEFDVNFLYYVLPSTSVSIGYKQLRQRNFQATTRSEVNIDGVTAAVSASAPLSEHVGLFGSVAVGRLHSDVLPLVGSNLKTTYLSSEVGLSYSVGWFGRASAITASYRQQRYTVRDYPILGVNKSLTDTTHGPAIGFVTTF